MILKGTELLVVFFIFIGALLGALSAFGLIRLPDVYLRSHAATKSATLGVLFVLTGVFLYLFLTEGYLSGKLLLGIIFVFMTSPVAGHLNGRAAYRTGVPLCKMTVRNDLKFAKLLEKAKRN